MVRRRIVDSKLVMSTLFHPMPIPEQTFHRVKNILIDCLLVVLEEVVVQKEDVKSTIATANLTKVVVVEVVGGDRDTTRAISPSLRQGPMILSIKVTSLLEIMIQDISATRNSQISEMAETPARERILPIALVQNPTKIVMATTLTATATVTKTN